MMLQMLRHSAHTEQAMAAVCRPGRLAHAAVYGPPVRKCSRCLGAPGICFRAVPSRQSQQTGRAALVCPARPSDQQTALSPQSLWSPKSVTLLLFWAAFAGYSFGFSPNQTLDIDIQSIKQLSGLVASQDQMPINPIFSQLTFCMGAWPWAFAALLVPSGRNSKGVPAWPFILLSFVFTFYALAPYFAVWTPSPPNDVTAIPPDNENAASARAIRRVLEAQLPALVLLGAFSLFVGRAILSGPEAWGSFPELFGQSRAVHATTLDFAALTLAAPFWVLNDASRRGWQERRPFPAGALAFLPILGVPLYLVLRPRAQ